MNSFAKSLKNVLIWTMIAGSLLLFLGYRQRESLNAFFSNIVEVFIPEACSKPLEYRLGDIDPHFGISKKELLNFVERAAKIWGDAASKKLFRYSDGGKLAINLIYDYRQKATEELGKLGIVIKEDRATYEVLKEKYDSMSTAYRHEKNLIQAEIESYDQKKISYEEQVRYWNSRGGAPKEQYEELERKKFDLNAEAESLTARQKTFNDLVNTLNSVATILNKLINELNISVKNYNTVGSSTGKEFNEGEYVSDSFGERLNIYQFGDANQLERVLEHELGHALGLEHVGDPNAVMYRLNEAVNERLTPADIGELKRVCGLK